MSKKARKLAIIALHKHVFPKINGRNLFFEIIAQAIKDLGDYRVREALSARQFFVTGRFILYAELSGLDPDFVADILDISKLVDRKIIFMRRL